MKTVFENKTVNSIEEYEKLVRERLEILKKESPELFVASPYYDYNDHINLDDLDEDLSVEEIEDKMENEIYENCEIWRISFDLINDLVFDVNVELEEDLESEYDNRDFIYELTDDYVIEDSNLEELCGKTELYMNVFPYQDENANSEGSELEIALEALIKRYVYPEGSFYYDLSDDEKELEEIINNNELLVKLFESQGYEFKDIGDEEVVKSSKFLSSLIQEINNNTLYGSAFITFLIKTDAGEYFDCFRNKDKEIVFRPEKDLVCGIFNPVHGSGSVLELELENAFSCPTDKIFIQIEDRKSNYGYTVNEVCGLCGYAWTHNFYVENRK